MYIGVRVYIDPNLGHTRATLVVLAIHAHQHTAVVMSLPCDATTQGVHETNRVISTHHPSSCLLLFIVTFVVAPSCNHRHVPQEGALLCDPSSSQNFKTLRFV